MHETAAPQVESSMLPPLEKKRVWLDEEVTWRGKDLSERWRTALEVVLVLCEEAMAARMRSFSNRCL